MNHILGIATILTFDLILQRKISKRLFQVKMQFKILYEFSANLNLILKAPFFQITFNFYLLFE